MADNAEAQKLERKRLQRERAIGQEQLYETPFPAPYSSPLSRADAIEGLIQKGQLDPHPFRNMDGTPRYPQDPNKA